MLAISVTVSTVDFDSTSSSSNLESPANNSGEDALMVGQLAVTQWPSGK